MKLASVVKTSFVVGFVITLLGAYLKIMHAGGANTWLTIGIIAWLVFTVTAIYEVRTSKKIDDLEKTRWTIAFIFLNSITGVIYILIGRKRIASNS